MLEFNLLSVVRCVRAAIPAMLRRGGGAIVNVSSTHAHQPSAANVEYGAAKAALANLTQALSEEFGPQGVRVNTPRRPGDHPADVNRGRPGAAGSVATLDSPCREPTLIAVPARRSAEVAAQIVLLASPRAGSTTGADVLVDAGQVKTV